MTLPNFLIIGAQKAGSSWFSENLGDHPDVFVAPRELYYFTTEYDKGTSWYEALFEGAAGEKRVGDGTPGYIFHPEAPGRIRETLGPDVRMIGSLRHPVDRAYSAFWNYLSWGRLGKDPDFRRLFLETDELEMRRRGFYFEQITRFLEIFPREQLLLFVYEEDLKRGPETIQRCYEFLDVDADFLPPRLGEKVNKTHDIRAGHRFVESIGIQISRATKSLPQSVRGPLRSVYGGLFGLLPKKADYVPLDEDLRQELMGVYRDDVARLEELLDRDLSIWNQPRKRS